jgi:hypothetical protein
MAYCRWGEDSDIYCYGDGAGLFHTYVRANTGPLAGQAFYDSGLPVVRKRLLDLREAGYRFPDDVFEQIDEEMQEEESRSSPA